MKAVQIAAAADLHGNLPVAPEGRVDFLFLVGDLAHHEDSRSEHSDTLLQMKWINGPFKEWCKRMSSFATHIVATGGNHDYWARKGMELDQDHPLQMLLYQAAQIGDLNIYGCPASNRIPVKASCFMKNDMEMKLLFDEIRQEDIHPDVFLSHAPPTGFGDCVAGSKESYGSKELTNWIKWRVDNQQTRLQLVLCGHIHGGRGKYSMERKHSEPVLIGNCSVLDDNMKMVEGTPYLYYSITPGMRNGGSGDSIVHKDSFDMDSSLARSNSTLIRQGGAGVAGRFFRRD